MTYNFQDEQNIEETRLADDMRGRAESKDISNLMLEEQSKLVKNILSHRVEQQSVTSKVITKIIIIRKTINSFCKSTG